MELTETQQEIIKFAVDMKTPMLIKGAAGSGKSFITSEIAKIFYERRGLLEENRIGVVSYTNALVKDLRKKINLENVKVNTAQKTLNLFLEYNNQATINNYDRSSDGIGPDGIKYICQKLNSKYKYDFLDDEFTWLFSKGINSLQEYENTCRSGRGQGSKVDKAHIWEIFGEYKKYLRTNNLYNFSEIANICLDYIKTNNNYKPLFTHLIIDELQDLRENDIKALIRTCKYPNNIVFVGDLAQSIYKRNYSWRNLNINRGKTFELTDNLRNSKQIALAAERLLDNEYKLKLYEREDYTEMISSGQNGPKPIIAICRDEREQNWYIQNELSRIHKENSGESIAIIRRIKPTRYDAQRNTFGAELLTMHSCKGLEFDNVFIVDVNEDLLPYPQAIKDDEDSDIANERRLLYVAMTRARKKLFITTSGTPSRFLKEINPTTISPVAIDNDSYEKLYNERLDELFNLKEKTIKELIEENKNLKETNENNEKIIAAKEKIKFVDSTIRDISHLDVSFRPNAKVLILGGDGGMDENDVYYTLKHNFGLERNDYKWIHYKDMQRFNVEELYGTSQYCDVIIGCIPHNSGGCHNLITEIEQNKDKEKELYLPLMHILKDNGGLSKLTKQKLKDSISNSNILKIKQITS